MRLRYNPALSQDATTPNPKPSRSRSQNKENALLRPASKIPQGKGHGRYGPQKWADWELSFAKKCFQTNNTPPSQLLDYWALILSEEKLVRVNVKDNGDIAHDWHAHYRRRLKNWFKNTRAKVKREEAVKEEDFTRASTSQNVLEKLRNVLNMELKKFPPRSVQVQGPARLIPGPSNDVVLPTAVPEGEERLEELANQACDQLEQISMGRPKEDERYLSSYPSRLEELATQTLLRGKLQVGNKNVDVSPQCAKRYEPDVILGATLLMQLRDGPL